MARLRAALTAAAVLGLLGAGACDSFYTVGPAGCDSEHACQDPQRPRCELSTGHCLAGLAGLPDLGAALSPCRRHGDCESGVCDEFGVVLPRPKSCVPAADTATVKSAGELAAALADHLGVRLLAGSYAGDWQLARSVVLVGPRAQDGRAPPPKAAVLLPREGAMGPVLRLAGATRLALDGVSVQGGKGAQGHGILCDGTEGQLFLRRAEAAGNEGRGVWSRCALWMDQSTLSGNQGGGLLCEADITAINTFVLHNGSAFSEVGGIALRAPGTAGAGHRLLAHLTLVGNYSSGEGNAIHCHDAGPTDVWDSLFYDNASVHSIFGGSCLVHAAATDSLDFPNFASIMFSDMNPPRFVRDNDDHLLLDSPAVDKVPAKEGGPLLDHDVDGDPRPLGLGWDFGADEVVPF